MTTDSFVIYPLLCPVGYSIGKVVVHQGLECLCREDVQQILTCEDDQDTILLQVICSVYHCSLLSLSLPHSCENNTFLLSQSGYWGAPYTDPRGYSEEINNFYPCPAGYCRCSQETSLGPTMCVYTYTNSQPDAQCVCNRRGE